MGTDKKLLTEDKLRRYRLTAMKTEKTKKRKMSSRLLRSQAKESPATRLARVVEEHLATLPSAEQDKRISAARAVLARARAARLATMPKPLAKTRTLLAALKHG